MCSCALRINRHTHTHTHTSHMHRLVLGDLTGVGKEESGEVKSKSIRCCLNVPLSLSGLIHMAIFMKC